MASQVPPKKNTAFTLYFTLYKNDGTVIANPGTYTKKIIKDGGSVADIAASVTKVDTTYGCCSVVLSATEMNADAVWVQIKDDTTGCVPFTVILYTAANLMDDIKTDTANNYAILNHTDYGNAKLVRSTTPANTLAVDANHLVAVPTTQEVVANLTKILGATVTGTAANIVGAFTKFFDKTSPTGTINSLPNAVPGANGGLPTTDGTKVLQTVDLTSGQSIACSDKTGFSLSATGLDLILHGATFCVALATAVWELATRTLSAFAFTPSVNVATINSISTSSVTTVSPYQGTTQPINFTGTTTSALVKGDTIDWNSVAVTTPAVAGSPVVTLGATQAAYTPAKAGDAMLITAGTSTGQLDVTSGVIKANLVQILAATITGTAAQIVAAFTKFFDKASPTGTINSLPNAVPGANGGLPTTDGTKINQTVDLTSGQSVGVSGDLTTTMKTSVENAVLDADLLTHHTTTGTVGKDISNAGALGDPWGTNLPGAYTAGKAGYIIGTNLDAKVSTRTAPADSQTIAANQHVIVDSGTVTTVTNLTNAPTNGDFTATMKASINTSGVGVTVGEIKTALETAGGSIADILALVELENVGIGGTGHTYTLTVGGQPCADALIIMSTDSLMANPIHSGRTNAAGQITFYPNLTAGTTVYIWRYKTDAEFDNPDVETI